MGTYLNPGNRGFTDIMIVLASASPRRADILRSHGVEAPAVPADVEEYVPKDGDGVPPHILCMYNALKKALYVSASYPDDAVVGADTIVVYGGEILGKPEDEDDAFRMLAGLRGHTHQVYTGTAVVRAVSADSGKNKKTDEKPVSVKRVFYERTGVTFGDYSDSDIIDYIKSGEPMDKAGSYAVQGRWSSNVVCIDGDIENVIGLPWKKLDNELRKIIGIQREILT